MKSRSGKSISALLLLMFLFTGCFGVNRSFKGVRDYAMFLSNSEYEEEFEFSLGSVTLSMAEIALNFSDIDEPVNEIVSEISNIQIGVYSKNSGLKVKPSKNELKFITQKMTKAGWDCIVKTRSKDEISAVFTRMNDEILSQLFIITVNEDELIIIEILGNLNKAIEYAISERGNWI